MARKLSQQLPGIVIGGGVFNTQMNSDPLNLPVTRILQRAFQVGATAIDTSPYYGPSEELVGKALRDPAIKGVFARESYTLMTKVGRVGLDEFDYSPDWVRQSVQRSLERLDTAYLDVVFCHDVEFVEPSEVVAAVRTLFELQAKGIVRYVGISGYPPAVIDTALRAIKLELGRVPDVIQNYSHFNLQNTVLQKYTTEWTALGVDCVINSSPLSMGLLSDRPIGDFHPAPGGLRDASRRAVEIAASMGYKLPDLGVRFVLGKWNELRAVNGGGFLIFGVSIVEELDNLVSVYGDMFHRPAGTPDSILVGNCWDLDTQKLQLYEPAFEAVRDAFGQWFDYAWSSPPEGWVRH